MGKFDWFITFN